MGYWKATGVEAGFGIQVTIYTVTDENPKKASWTLNWVCNPQSGELYSLNTFSDGRVERRKGSIDEDGNVRLKSNSVGGENDAQDYNVNTWNFDSEDKIQFKRIDYKNGQEERVGNEVEMIRISN